MHLRPAPPRPPDVKRRPAPPRLASPHGRSTGGAGAAAVGEGRARAGRRRSTAANGRRLADAAGEP